MKRSIVLLAGLLVLLGCMTSPGAPADPWASSYAVVVSKATLDLPEWAEVVEALEGKYGGARRLIYETDPAGVLDQLRDLHPRYTCFVMRPEEAGHDAVIKIHTLTRSLDDDPYTDTLWGILTGYTASNALAIARHREPLTVRKVASGTEIALEMVEEGGWYDELVAGKKVWKEAGGQPEQTKVPQDTTRALVDTLNTWQADCFVTSGHATERDWQLGYRYRNGSFRCKNGQLYGLDTQGRRYPVNAPHPKVYLPIGNCLMGHINGRDAMALAWMNSAGVHQMIGYIEPTWFGYAGWGCLDYFLEQPGRYSFIEAFFANHHALVHKLEQKPSRGLTFDRDRVAVYGDPAWVARMAPGPCAWQQTLKETDGVFTLTVTPNRGRGTFKPVNTNGSQRGGRPIVHFLPKRVQDVTVLEGAQWNPLIADDFILVPNPGAACTGDPMVVRFKSRKIRP